MELVEKAGPVLLRLGTTLLHIGPLGSASSLKLAMNLNLALMAEALGESLTLTRSQGIPDEKFFDALHLNVGRSGLSDLKETKFREQDYAPQFSLKHMNKDLRLTLETVGELDLPAAKALKLFYDKGLEDGLGDDDFIGMVRLLAKVEGGKKITRIILNGR
ncbi:MAG: NAD-binding protein [Verrucomicrobiota bacterium]